MLYQRVKLERRLRCRYHKVIREQRILGYIKEGNIERLVLGKNVNSFVSECFSVQRIQLRRGRTRMWKGL